MSLAFIPKSLSGGAWRATAAGGRGPGGGHPARRRSGASQQGNTPAKSLNFFLRG